MCKQEELASKHGYRADALPPVLGGTCTSPTYEEWAKAQLAAREVIGPMLSVYGATQTAKSAGEAQQAV